MGDGPDPVGLSIVALENLDEDDYLGLHDDVVATIEEYFDDS